MDDESCSDLDFGEKTRIETSVKNSFTHKKKSLEQSRRTWKENSELEIFVRTEPVQMRLTIIQSWKSDGTSCLSDIGGTTS